MLIRTIIVVTVLLALYFILRSMMSTGKQRPRTFRGPSFSRISKEVNKGELVQDPVSGTYISKDDAVVRTIGGARYYFASEENAEQFEQTRRSS